MKRTLYPIILALSVVSASAFAAGDPPAPPPEKKKDAILDRYSEASARKDWTTAAAAMRDGVARSPDNADYHNLYAYALRKGGSPNMDLVFKHYNEALRIDAKHRGAHEYLGEAYLMVGNVGKAKEHLASLDKLCFFGCPEYNELKKAIAEHETRSAKR